MKTNFAFTLEQAVDIVISGEKGHVRARSEHVDSQPQYMVSYKAADGRATSGWFSEDQLKPNSQTQATGTHELINDQVHQTLQTGAVSVPVFRRSKGFRPIVVQVNARQVVVAAVADITSIRSSKCFPELEGVGMSLVFDPIFTLRTDRLVVAVQREISAIIQSLQTIGQQGTSKRVSHNKSPSSLIEAAILAMPQGSGKLAIAPGLAAELGLHTVIEEWHPGQPLTADALHCTHTVPDELPENVALIWIE